MDALLVDEPVPGISRIRQPVKLLTEFLRHCEEQEKELEEYQVILHILQYAQSRLAGKEQETVKQPAANSCCPLPVPRPSSRP